MITDSCGTAIDCSEGTQCKPSGYKYKYIPIYKDISFLNAKDTNCLGDERYTITDISFEYRCSEETGHIIDGRVDSTFKINDGRNYICFYAYGTKDKVVSQLKVVDEVINRLIKYKESILNSFENEDIKENVKA